MATTVLNTVLLPVMESFYTLQGEGYFQGKAAYFIRLGGCDVGCVWCDVKESWDAEKHPKFSIDEIMAKVNEEVLEAIRSKEQGTNDKQQAASYLLQELRVKPIIVITGGEPLMHNLDELTDTLHAAGYQNNIETSGAHPMSGKWDWVCLSPKKFKAPLPGVIQYANELKVVIYHKSDFEWAEQYAAIVSPACKLYLQPEWDKAAQVTPLITDYIKANPKWELSLQLHKYINVP
jgi:7-carboxy-7-deazaguanine synthase